MLKVSNFYQQKGHFGFIQLTLPKSVNRLQETIRETERLFNSNKATERELKIVFFS